MQRKFTNHITSVVLNLNACHRTLIAWFMGCFLGKLMAWLKAWFKTLSPVNASKHILLTESFCLVFVWFGWLYRFIHGRAWLITEQITMITSITDNFNVTNQGKSGCSDRTESGAGSHQPAYAGVGHAHQWPCTGRTKPFASVYVVFPFLPTVMQ